MKRAFTSKDLMVFPWFHPFALELVDKMMGIFEVVWGLTYKWFDDMGRLLGNTIGDGPPTGNNGPEGVACFVDFGHKGGTVVCIFGC